MNTQLIPSENEMLSKAQGVFDLLDVNENTRSNYKKDIQVFIEFMKGRKMDINTFLEFKRDLSVRSLSTSTKQKYLSVARTLLKQICKMGYLPTDITVNIKGFKQTKGHKKDGLSEEDIQTICTKMQLIDDARLKAILALLTYNGLRQMEVIGLSIEDLDLKNLKAKITGKGRDDQEVINLHPQTAKMVEIYLKDSHVSQGPLFVSESNNSKGKRLTTKSLRRLVTKTLADYNIQKSTHGFRHFFVSNILKKTNGNMLLTKTLSRHKSFDMLTIYNDELITTQQLSTFHNAFDGVRM